MSNICHQVRAIRKKMCEIITKSVTGSELREVVNKLIPDLIAKDIEKVCNSTYPLHDVYIRKVIIHFTLTFYIYVWFSGKDSA